jgi:hypothetical protein
LAGAQVVWEPSSVTTRACANTRAGMPDGMQRVISAWLTAGVAPTSP